MSHAYPPDRNKSIAWAKHVLITRNRWVILDTETTGIGPRDEVIQIAVIDLKGTVRLDSYIQPIRRKKIPLAATAVHGITINMLQGAPSYLELFPRLEKSVADRTIIAYNAEFDKQLLDQTARINQAQQLEASWACAMLQYARFVGEWLAFKQDYQWQKLPFAGHNALADCQAILDLIQKMAKTPMWRPK